MPDMMHLEVTLDPETVRLKAIEILEAIDAAPEDFEVVVGVVAELLAGVYMEGLHYSGEVVKALDSMNLAAADTDRYRTALNEIIDGARDPISVAWKARWPEAANPERPVYGPVNPDTGVIGGMD